LEIEKTNDWDTKRRVVETLVTEVVIRTSGQGRQKQAKADVTYCFTKPRSVAVATIS
jgi:hypothetical protein